MKEYPIKKIGNKMVDVCECGHQWCYHGFDHKNCEECGCPEYEYEQTMTINKAIELRYIISDKANKDNYCV